jgi:hypothetical protein
MAIPSAFWLLRSWTITVIVINTALLALASIAAIALKGVGLSIYYDIAGGESQPVLLFTSTNSSSWLGYPPSAYGLDHAMISYFYFSCTADLTLALALSLVLWRCLRKGPLMVTSQ